ncbi:MAG: alpha-amylase family glycosyl hydrolase [Bacteroidota bacterium]
MDDALIAIEQKLHELFTKNNLEATYLIPSVWKEPDVKHINKISSVQPFEFFINRISKIREIAASSQIIFNNSADWSKEAIVYNMFVRYATAFDHNGDGVINPNLGIFDLRETGTFLKAIALLPYIYSLGANTIYLLPVTSIGIDGKKGTLGSPYAIKNPYKIDEYLSEPVLELGEEAEFKAFVQATHLLGIKVVTEFVFRTASIDCELAIKHPEWFYWIKDDIGNRPQGSGDTSKYGPPVFSESEIKLIKDRIYKNNFEALPAPSELYKSFFTVSPKLITVTNDKIMGIINREEQCKIPGAFADWPPDDIQPVWSDVTYLKLFEHPDFNYIAYNTVRMYDTKLAVEANQVNDLWENICNIIPYYQNNFGIDGVMIDMGHALPCKLRLEIVERARKNYPDFAFWEENFLITEESAKEGYNATVGYLPFDGYKPEKVTEFINMLSQKIIPMPFFCTTENHNTHRTAAREGGVELSKFVWAYLNLIPGIPFIHAGFELAETVPVNTGLGFTNEETEKFPPDKLPLFSESALCWDNYEDWFDEFRRISVSRKRFIKISNNFNPDSIIPLKNSNTKIISFARKFDESGKLLIFLGNMQNEKELYFEVKLPKKSKRINDYFSGKFFNIVNDELIFNLKPFEYFIGELIIG